MADPSGPDLCHCLAARRVARLLTRTYDKRLAPTGINLSQFGILSRLAQRPGRSMSELARDMAMERTTLVRALRPLRESSYVVAEAGHGRELAFTLTDEGRAKVAEAAPYWKQAQAEHEKATGVERSRRLRADLVAFANRG